MDNFGQGLLLSLYGVSITFLALGVLILLMYLLQWLFKPKTGSQDASPAVGEPSADLEHAAAIAAAWYYLKNERTPGLGELLEKSPGRYWRKNQRL